MKTIGETILQAAEALKSVSDSARLDAELLLCAVLKKNRTFISTWPEQELAAQQLTAFKPLLQRRINGEPVAHILGERGFWSLNLKVTADTLIPRPDTERLVELALEQIAEDSPLNILDMGTGTGAIALSIAAERPACQITATDKSAAALAIARENAHTHNLTNVQFIRSDWFSALENQRFDIIVSNPPYICNNDPHLEQGDVRFEPLTALTSGEDGLDDIRHIIRNSPAHLVHGGILLLEHGYDQANAVCQLLTAAHFEEVKDFNDHNQQPRVAIGHFK